MNTRTFAIIALIGAFIWLNYSELSGAIGQTDPFPGEGKRVLIIRDASLGAMAKLPQSQINIFTSKALDDWKKANKVDVKILDPDADVKYLDDVWAEGLAKPRDSLPWMIQSGRGGHAGLLPVTIDETIETLDKGLK